MTDQRLCVRCGCLAADHPSLVPEACHHFEGRASAEVLALNRVLAWMRRKGGRRGHR